MANIFTVSDNKRHTYFFLNSQWGLYRRGGSSLDLPHCWSNYCPAWHPLRLRKMPAITSNDGNMNKNQPIMYYFFPWIPWKRRNVYQLVRGRRHNSRGSNRFFPHMLLGASLVQQRGRLQHRKRGTKTLGDKQTLDQVSEPVFDYISQTWWIATREKKKAIRWKNKHL